MASFLYLSCKYLFFSFMYVTLAHHFFSKSQKAQFCCTSYRAHFICTSQRANFICTSQGVHFIYLLPYYVADGPSFIQIRSFACVFLYFPTYFHLSPSASLLYFHTYFSHPFYYFHTSTSITSLKQFRFLTSSFILFIIVHPLYFHGYFFTFLRLEFISIITKHFIILFSTIFQSKILIYITVICSFCSLSIAFFLYFLLYLLFKSFISCFNF
jgi:hypothetical protein